MKGRNLLMIQYDLRYFGECNLYWRLGYYEILGKIKANPSPSVWRFKEACICAMTHLAYSDFTGNLDAPV